MRMSLGSPKKKTTAAQRFKKLFDLCMDERAPQGERDSAKRKADAWLKQHQKSWRDASSILAQAAADDAAAAPPAPPSDPRDGTAHPFESSEFSPVGVVTGIVSKYVRMPSDHALIIFALWICFTHVYEQFGIAPRLALVSDEPDSGKTTAKNVAKRLVRRPNPESFGTAAALSEFIDQGPCTILLDELDQVDKEGRRRLQLIWNLGHERGAKYAMVIGGTRKLVNLHAPVLAAGVGGFLAQTQKSRTFSLEMEPYTEDTKPAREFSSEQDFSDLDAVYGYLRHWARKVKLDPKPEPPPGVIRRFGDNVRGLLAIADSCGPEWGQRAREAILFVLEKEQAERPHITIVRHGLAIFDALGVDQIGSVHYNAELKRLDLPDAKWSRYRGASGVDYAHPIAMHEQAGLLQKAGIESVRLRFSDGQRRGYGRAQFEEALRNERRPSRADQLRLISQSDV